MAKISAMVVGCDLFGGLQCGVQRELDTSSSDFYYSRWAQPALGTGDEVGIFCPTNRGDVGRHFRKMRDGSWILELNEVILKFDINFCKNRKTA